jgi:cobalt-zinc-cadmium efflux system membrane fusion protein
MVRNRLRILGESETDIAALRDARRLDPLTVVRAPISGTVTERAVGFGQYIQSGSSTPVYSIGDLSAVWLIANVRETDAPLMHRGEPVEVRVMAFPDRVFRARLSYVSSAADFAREPNRGDLPLSGRRPPGYSVTDLKTLQDRVLRRRFQAVPGVIDVTG